MRLFRLTRLYRQGVKDWGLSIPWNVLKELPEADLEIDIVTSEYECEMKVLDLYIPGSSDKEILLMLTIVTHSKLMMISRVALH